MQRFTRIFGSLLATVAAYFAYAAVAVPLIEPKENITLNNGKLTPDEEKRAEEAARRQRKDLERWFAKGDWELEQPKILETSQGKLLFNEYTPMDDGVVELKPCSIVFLSQQLKNDTEEQKRRAFVLRAPQGALLKFDGPMDAKSLQLGKLIGGELLGEVHIHSGQRLPGPEDDMVITTRDVQLTESRITTPHLLEFKLAEHHGRGRGVIIDLEQAQASPGQTDFRGLKSLTLREQVYVYLAPSGQGDFFPGDDKRPKSPQPTIVPAAVTTTTPVAQGDKPPTEIRCSGPFVFDQVRNVAVFRDAVDVVRRHPTGEPDRMNGDQLTVFFEAVKPTAPPAPENGEAPPAAAADTAAGGSKLDPRRIEVVGNPVVIRAPGNGMTARAQFVEHDLVDRWVKLRDAVEAIVRQPGREVIAPELYFLPEPQGDYGTFLATGRGRLQSTAPDGSGELFEAQWERRFHFRRHEGQYVLSADGGARLSSVGKGTLAASEIHVWFRETVKLDAAGGAALKPDGTAQQELQPDRMLAFGEVKIESTQMNCDVERMEGWFEQIPVGPQVRQALHVSTAALLTTHLVGAPPLVFPSTGSTPQPALPQPTLPQSTVPQMAVPQAAPTWPTGQTPAPQLPGAAVYGPPVGAPPQGSALQGPSLGGPSFGSPSVQLTAELPAPARLFVHPESAQPVEAAPPAMGGDPRPVPVDPRAVPVEGGAFPVEAPAGSTAGEPKRKFHIRGELLRLRVAIEREAMQVREAIVERKVKLIELAAAVPGEQPLSIQGDRLHLTRPSAEHSHVTVTGAPAYVEARGMTMSGGKLDLDRPDAETNILSVDGQGLMTLPVDRDLQGTPTAGTETLQLTWQGRLDFDGLTARFQRGVEARLTHQYLQTDRLDVTFSERVRLSDAGATGTPDNASGGRPDPRKIDCYDGVFLESRTVENGILKSVERLRSRDLTADRVTGDFAASGPGEVRSIRLGKPDDKKKAGFGFAGPGGPPSQAADPQAGAAAPTIEYLNVDFQRNMIGNQHRRETTFHNQVRAIRGPVADWNDVIDDDRPDTWTGNTVMIDCDRLQVTSRRDQMTASDMIEMVAEGNTLVEAPTFTSRSPRVSYDQAKGLLVIEGDARTDAALYHRNNDGANTETTAKKFMVWPDTRRVQVDGATFLELTPN
jgi:hypothetical protein